MSWPSEVTAGMVEEKHFGRRLKVFSERSSNLYTMLKKTVDKHEEREALACYEERYSYREFKEIVDKVAYSLSHQWGINKGDRIAILLNNVPEFCFAIFAAAKIGAVAVPLNTRLQSPEMSYMLQDSGARLLITCCQQWPLVESILDEVSLEQVFFREEDYPSGEKTSSFSRLLPEKYEDVEVETSEDETAFIMYTSGTTGRPKGAMVAHLNNIHSAISYVRCFNTNYRDRTLLTVPLFHVTGLIGQLFHLFLIGGAVVLQPEYKTDEMLRLMDKEKITFCFVVPTIYVLMLMKELDKYDLSSFRIAAYGGAPMSKETVLRLSELFSSLEMHNAYGATETASPTTLLPAKDALRKTASVGLPIPGAEVKVVDENGNELPPGGVGELWIKGSMVVPGYWHNEEANQSEFSNSFWHSGDLAMIDDEGYVYIMDRKKDMINRGGEKIFCVEVEDVLYSYPKVLEAALVGVPDKIFGEQAKAVIVPRPEEIITEEEIKGYVASKLADYKVPKYVEFREELPRNPGGKVIKSQLK